MGADRGVDAAGAVQRVLADHLVVERLAHAVQALELPVQAAAELVDGGERVGVVGGELGVDRVGGGEQLLRAGQVGDVGVDLAGVDRVARLAVLLGALDLAVPVGTLDQADHEAVAGAAGRVDQPVEHEGAALLVGLDDDADAVPAGELGIGGDRLDQVERELEPVGLLGVDVAADVVAAGEQQQRLQARQQLGHDAGMLGTGVARVEGRELHRDAGAGIDPPAPAGLADGVDRVLVGGEVAGGVGGGHRGLAQHVVGEAVAARLAGDRTFQRLLDRLAGDELLAEQAHGEVDRGADHGLAALRDQAGQRRGEALLAGGGDQLAGDQEAPGRGVDEDRGAVAEMGAPVATGQLVADQPVGGGGVGDAQERLGQAHQGDALLAGERELLHQRVDARGAGALAAHFRHQLPGEGLHRRHLLGRHPRRIDHATDAGLLVLAIGAGDGVAQWRLRARERA